MKENKGFNWNPYSLASNSNISWREIFENPDIFSIGSCGCYHPHAQLSWADYVNLPETHKSYVVYDISRCEDITWEYVETHPILFESTFLLDYKQTWNYRALSQNTMSEPSRKRIQARNKLIEDELIQIVYHPDYIKRKIGKYGKEDVCANM